MVNRGKPSKGCDSCRKRKIKCDEGRPICAQCQRSKRTCNFRDQLDLLFVHQNRDDVKVAAERKASKSCAASRRIVKQVTQIKHVSTTQSQRGNAFSQSIEFARVNDHPIRFQTRATNDRRFQPTRQVPKALSSSLSDQAMTFFLKHYVISNDKMTRGQYEYLPGMCSKIGADPLLLLSVTASGLAALANRFADAKLTDQATLVYNKAICMAQVAVVSTTRCREDSTLLSILLLGRFESITQKDKAQKQTWSMHLSGAAKMIQMRGMAQFQNAIGRRIFQLFFNFLLIDCVTNRAPMRKDMLNIRERAAPMYDTTSPEWRLASINIGLAHFYAEVQANRAPSPQYVLTTALSLDGRLIELADDMYATNAWRYHIIYLDHGRSHEFAYHGFYHIYNEYWMAQVWNSLRGVRLLLNEIIVKFLTASATKYPNISHVPEHMKSQWQDSWTSLTQMTIEICASIPQYMGQLSSADTIRNSSSSIATTDSLGGRAVWPIPASFVSPNSVVGKSLSPLSIALSSPRPYTSSSQPPASIIPCSTLASSIPSAVSRDRCCSSIYVHPPTVPSTNSTMFQRLPTLDPSPAVGQAVNFFLWPLFVAGMVSSTEPTLRLWIMSQLELVGRTNGNRQADALASVLKHQEPGDIQGFSLWREEEDQKHVDFIGI